MPLKGYKHSGEHNRKISETLKGHKHTEESKRKMSEMRKGKPSGALGKHWFGKKRSEETKRKMSKARKGKRGHWFGKKRSEETKRRMREAKKNHKPKFHTEKTKQKIREARLKQKLPTIDTSIEIKTKEWLDRKGINYIHPFNLGDKFQCDFYIPTLNLIVECDGTYWHSRPDMKKRDKAKDAYAKKCGFNIIRLTEEQINQGRFLNYG